MRDGKSGELWYGFHAYHNNNLLPSQFASLPTREKAIIKAYIDIEIEEREKAEKKAKKARKG